MIFVCFFGHFFIIIIKITIITIIIIIIIIFFYCTRTTLFLTSEKRGPSCPNWGVRGGDFANSGNARKLAIFFNGCHHHHHHGVQNKSQRTKSLQTKSQMICWGFVRLLIIIIIIIINWPQLSSIVTPYDQN